MPPEWWVVTGRLVVLGTPVGSGQSRVHLLGDCRSPWVLAHNTARWAGDGYASVDMALWADDALVAYATQLSFFTFLA